MWRIKPWIALTMLPFIVLGCVFMVLGLRADPAARTADGYSLKWFFYVMGMWFIGLTVLVYGGIFLWVGSKNRRVARMQEESLRGVATVIASHATGNELNNLPQLEMELEVILEGRPAYTVNRTEYVNPVNVASCQRGAQLPVLVDPHDPEKLIIDWR